MVKKKGSRSERCQLYLPTEVKEYFEKQAGPLSLTQYFIKELYHPKHHEDRPKTVKELKEEKILSDKKANLWKEHRLYEKGMTQDYLDATIFDEWFKEWRKAIQVKRVPGEYIPELAKIPVAKRKMIPAEFKHILEEEE